MLRGFQPLTPRLINSSALWIVCLFFLDIQDLTTLCKYRTNKYGYLENNIIWIYFLGIIRVSLQWITLTHTERSMSKLWKRTTRQLWNFRATNLGLLGIRWTLQMEGIPLSDNDLSTAWGSAGHLMCILLMVLFPLLQTHCTISSHFSGFMQSWELHLLVLSYKVLMEIPALNRLYTI